MPRSGILQAWWGLSQAHHHISDHMDRALTKTHGLSISWFEVLEVLARQSEPIRVSDLSQQVTLSPSRTCRVLHALEERGVVTRTSSPTDARSTEVLLTDKGGELHAQALAAVQDALAQTVLSRLSAEEIAGMAALRGLIGPAGAAPAATAV
ncbi:MarR family transcriptional regulator [Kitasatospora sp. GP82]|uniref:MarR family winged helix-turn-helix transcriptional regulator n=1 Tax=Kitasatospora sp. GP82 TaxID=3035089 RepID=UPI002475596B|nr:MarR family transcriptional regulator [Kitasatospora sp. GP82]MDH6124053.1 DNA-binding MarR family transcriptional regulator [Kitasatospora sp. GP82]